MKDFFEQLQVILFLILTIIIILVAFLYFIYYLDEIEMFLCQLFRDIFIY